MAVGEWSVIYVVVYNEDFDAPRAQFIAAGVSQEEAAACAADTEAITAREKELPVHWRHAELTQRYVLQIRARSGVTAMMRALMVLQMDAKARNQYQIQLAAPDSKERD